MRASISWRSSPSSRSCRASSRSSLDQLVAARVRVSACSSATRRPRRRCARPLVGWRRARPGDRAGRRPADSATTMSTSAGPARCRATASGRRANRGRKARRRSRSPAAPGHRPAVGPRARRSAAARARRPARAPCRAARGGRAPHRRGAPHRPGMDGVAPASAAQPATATAAIAAMSHGGVLERQGPCRELHERQPRRRRRRAASRAERTARRSHRRRRRARRRRSAVGAEARRDGRRRRSRSFMARSPRCRLGRSGHAAALGAGRAVPGRDHETHRDEGQHDSEGHRR